ncbi:MAG: dihydrofolate reductase [bacterium]|nr:dihydrofolate reductase [bacterium]
MKISIIAAMDQKRGIGKENRIPWHIKEDLVHLKGLTLGNVVILGRKSYDSMIGYYNKSGNPMPGKLYIVITRDASYKPARENTMTAHSLEEAFSFARGRLAKLEEVFVIGGAQIFQQAIAVAEKLYLTLVDGEYNTDTFFPDYSEFKKVVSEKESQSEKYKYKFLELEK